MVPAKKKKPIRIAMPNRSPVLLSLLLTSALVTAEAPLLTPPPLAEPAADQPTASQPPGAPMPQSAAYSAPVIVTSTLPSATESQPYSARIEVNAQPGQRLSYSLVQGPRGMSITPEGLLEWTPGFAMAGKHDVKVNVSDAVSVVPKSFVIEVANTNRPPQLRVRVPDQLYENQRFSLVMEGSDPDGSALAYGMEGAPAGMVIDQNVVSWTPTFDQAGEYRVTLSVADPEMAVQQEVLLKVANINRSPIWKTKEFGKAVEASPYRLPLEASDPDGSPLTFRLVTGPEGMVLAQDGALEWTPGYKSAGTTQVTLTVGDGEEDVAWSFGLPVANTNRPPSITGEPVTTGAEASEYRYTVQVADPDEEKLEIRIIQGPPLMRVSDNTLLWSPGYKEAGSYPVEIELTDGEAAVRQKFVLAIQNTNRPPLFTPMIPTTLSATENQEWRNSIDAKDADGQAVTLRLAEGPQGLTFNNKQFVWRPDYEQAGEHPVVVVASDGESEVEYPFVITVKNVNRLPVFVSKPLLSGQEMSDYLYTVEATDPDRTEMQYTLVKAPEGMNIEGSDIRWTPGYEQAGNHGVILKATDGEATIEQSFTVVVANTNRPPVFDSQPETTVAENSAYRYAITVSDPDGNTVTPELVKGPNGLVLVEGALSWKPGYEEAGVYPVELRTSDGEATTTQAFELQVTNTNRLPIFISKPLQHAIESVAYGYKVVADDADRQKLTAQLKTAPAGMTIADGKVQWIPGYEQQGKHSVVVAVSDGEATVEQPFTVNVINTNREPMIEPISDQTLVAGKTFRYPLKASDVDGDPVKLRLEHAPAGMVINEKQELYWESDKKSDGAQTVIISVSDGDLQTRRHFRLQVNAGK